VPLDRGLYSVDIRTGEATPLASSITSIRGATNFDVSPDGSKIVFDDSGIGGRPQPGRVQVFLANIDGSDMHRITNDAVGASYASWSPDGSKIVYVGAWICCGREPAALSVLNFKTGTSTVLARGQRGNLQDPFFSPDGRSVYVTRWDWGLGEFVRDDLWEIPAAGGSTRLLLEDRGWATFSPDGSSIGYAWYETYAAGVGGHCFMDYGVALISDADGSDPRVLNQVARSDHRGTWPMGWSPDGTMLAHSEDLFPLDMNCTRERRTRGVYVQDYVMDMRTGGGRLVTFGEPLDWLDDRTLLVRAERTPEAGIGG